MLNCGPNGFVPSALTRSLRLAAIIVFGLGLTLIFVFLVAVRLRHGAVLFGGLIGFGVGTYLFVMSWLRRLHECLVTQGGEVAAGMGRKAEAARARKTHTQGELERFRAWWSWKGIYLKGLRWVFGALSIVPICAILATANRRWEMEVYLLMVGMAGMLMGGSVALYSICRVASKVANLASKQGGSDLED